MGKRRKHTVTRWIEDIVDDTKDFVDDILDRVKDVEEDARDAVKDVIDSGDDDDDDDVATHSVTDTRRITSELAILSATLEELTAKVNILAELQTNAAAAAAPPDAAAAAPAAAPAPGGTGRASMA